MLESDAILSKFTIVNNCLRSIERVVQGDPDKTFEDWTTQDIFVLNLQRAVQALIDAANLAIAKLNLGLPTSYKQSFTLLYNAKIISSELADKMHKMVGFRNIAVHEYEELDVEVLKAIYKNHLSDLKEFMTAMAGCKEIFKDLEQN